ncbi:fimbrial protein [Enterobacter sp.]|uniref:fimbrial protein n=1 Tax=Enterobacter sp. TaxID=42895 RepID=UPI00296F5448|nr:fimbrial protein [Enterobacter sp.]
MENKKSRRVLFRTLLAVGTLLSSQQVLAYGCAYEKNTGLRDAIMTGIADHVTITIGADAFDDNTSAEVYNIGQFDAGTVAVDCSQGANVFWNDPRYKKQGYTSNNLTMVAGMDRVYHTGIAGIGLVSSMTNDRYNVDLKYPVSWLAKYSEYRNEDIPRGNYTINARMAMAIKIYDRNALTPGRRIINLSQFKAKMVYGANADGTDSQGNNDDTGGDENYDAKITALFSPPDTAVIEIVNASCELPISNIEVDLGKISPSKIDPYSDTLAEFNIELAKCPREITVDYKFVNDDKDVVLLDNTILIPDNEPGSATGVGIQISKNVNHIIFDPLRLNHPKGAGSTGYTLAVEKDTDPAARGKFRDVTIPLKARYKRLHDHIPVTGGKVKATAHFEVHYH